jgi:hypothetical protein
MSIAYPCVPSRRRRRRQGFSMITRVRAACGIALIICAAHQSAKSAPELISEAASTRAIALESVTWKREPFPPTQPIPKKSGTASGRGRFRRPGRGGGRLARALSFDRGVCR